VPEPTSIYDQCLLAYASGGQSSVFELVLTKYPETQWRYCEPCESDSPVELDTGSLFCLVCGSLV
jgi:hypothetical protein